MSEIIYTHTEERRGNINFDDFSSRMQPADIKTSIFQSDRKVSVVTSQLIVGIPTYQHRDKRWYKWRTVASTGFLRNSSGSVVPYHAHRPWDFKRGTPWRNTVPVKPFQLLDGNDELSEVFKYACFQTFNIKTLHDVYPIAGEYGLSNYLYIPAYFRRAMRAPNMDEFATRVFGVKRRSPRLVAAIANTEPYISAIAHQFRGLVSDDLIISFMENNHFDDDMEWGFHPHTPWVRSVAEYINSPSREAIMTRGLDLSDTAHIYRLRGYPRDYAKHYLKKDEYYTSWSEVVK